MKWYTRLALLLEQEATARGEAARFPVYWSRTSTRSVEVFPSGGLFMGIPTQAMLDELDAVDLSVYLPKLAPADRTFFSNTLDLLRQNPGDPIGLHKLAGGYLMALEVPNRKRLNANTYRDLYTESDTFIPLLPAPFRQRAQAARLSGTIRSRASTFEIYQQIAPLPGEPGGPPALPTPPEPAAPPEPEPDALPDPEADDSPWARLHNIIFFGPPGTGKSFRLQGLARDELHAGDRVTRVTFHPEYGHHDFVGAYRPVVGWLPTHARFELHEGTVRQAEPRVYYTFEPGPFARILVDAIRSPQHKHVLVIEEINRGNCAAIFGDIFQLLDRDGVPGQPNSRGRSEYAIHPVSELAAWLNEQLDDGDWPAWDDGRLRLPRNLYLWATMNTSDQGLFPMDTAFKRRWSMEYMGVRPPAGLATRVPLHGLDAVGVPWRDLLEALNREVVAHTRTDDKQMGPWFVKPPQGSSLVSTVQFSSKVLFYLWSDVFRDEPQRVFVDQIHTYDDLVRAYRDGQQVFRSEVLAPLGLEADPDTEDPDTEDPAPADPAPADPAPEDTLSDASEPA